MRARTAIIALLLAGNVWAADNTKKPDVIEVKVQPPKPAVKAQTPAAKSAVAAKAPVTSAKTPAPAAPAKTDAPLNIAQICRELITADLGEQEWEKFVTKATRRYKDFEQEYDISNVKRFLDDKLITLAPRLLSGKGAVLKEFCCWLALYDFYVEPVPGYIQSIGETDKKWIKDSLADFDWNKAAEQIKDKAKGGE